MFGLQKLTCRKLGSEAELRNLGAEFINCDRAQQRTKRGLTLGLQKLTCRLLERVMG
jgi:hypothetical protein